MKPGTYQFVGETLEQRIRDTFQAFLRLCIEQPDPHALFGFGHYEDGTAGIVVSLGEAKLGFSPDEARALAAVGEKSLAGLPGTEAATFADPLSSFVIGLRAVIDKAEAQAKVPTP